MLKPPTEHHNPQQDWTVWLRAQRRKAVAALLRLILVLGGIGVAFSTYIVIQHGAVGRNFIFYLCAYAAVLVLFFARRVPDGVRGAGFVVVLILFAVYALVAGWLASSGRTLLLAAVIVSAVLISPRASYYAALLAFAIYVLFAGLYSSGWLGLRLLPDPTTLEPILVEGVGFSLALVMTAAGLWFFQQALQAATRANLQASESRASFHNIVERSSDAILVVNQEGIVRFLNPAAETFLNVRRAELLNKPFYYMISAGQHVEVEVRLPEGGKRIGDMRADLTEWDAQPAYLVLIRDISDRKQAEETISQANATLQDYTARLEKRSSQLITASQVSRAASEVLDLDALGQQVVDLLVQAFNLYYAGLFLVDKQAGCAVLHAGYGEAGRRMLAQGHRLPLSNTSMIGWCIVNHTARIALDVGADAIRFDNPLLPRTRSELALPLFSRGEVIGALTIQSSREKAFSDEDISTMQTMADILGNALSNARLYAQLQDELKERTLAEEEVRILNARLEDRVQQRTAQLEAANRELEAFSYSVSHDLRAPLRGLDGFSRILLEDLGPQLSEEVVYYLQKIRRLSQQMSQLIDDMLRLSRIGRFELKPRPLDLSAMVSSILQSLQAEAPGRQLEFEVEPGLTASGDENLVRIALENLLGNAWKFTSSRPTAHIHFGRNDDDEYFIRDNGVGFDMAYADKLFGAFQRLHSAEEFPGTGIGLAIVQRILNRHGGSIRAESEVGAGTTFYFRLG